MPSFKITRLPDCCDLSGVTEGVLPPAAGHPVPAAVPRQSRNPQELKPAGCFPAGCARSRSAGGEALKAGFGPPAVAAGLLHAELLHEGAPEAVRDWAANYYPGFPSRKSRLAAPPVRRNPVQHCGKVVPNYDTAGYARRCVREAPAVRNAGLFCFTSRRPAVVRSEGPSHNEILKPGPGTARARCPNRRPPGRSSLR